MLENYLSRICLDIFDHPSFLRNTHLQCWLICLRQSLAWASLIFSLMIAGQREPKKMENSKGQRGGLYHGTVVDAAATKSKHHFETQGAANRPVEPSLRCTSPFELDRFLIFLRVCMCLCVCAWCMTCVCVPISWKLRACLPVAEMMVLVVAQPACRQEQRVWVEVGHYSSNPLWWHVQMLQISTQLPPFHLPDSQ